jgi:hypothetical protein
MVSSGLQILRSFSCEITDLLAILNRVTLEKKLLKSVYSLELSLNILFRVKAISLSCNLNPSESRAKKIDLNPALLSWEFSLRAAIAAPPVCEVEKWTTRGEVE